MSGPVNAPAIDSVVLLTVSATRLQRSQRFYQGLYIQDKAIYPPGSFSRHQWRDFEDWQEDNDMVCSCIVHLHLT
jgi:hypothetical protein